MAIENGDHKHTCRPKIRQSTVILPSGRRVQSHISFNSISNDGGADDSDELAPLLSNNESPRQASGQPQTRVLESLQQFWQFINSKTGRGIIKCSIAYVLASLATFIPVVSDLLGKQDGKHIVATVSVYYHPARSVGSMLEATMCAAAAFLYAATVSFSSMGTSIFFGRTLDNIVLGHGFVLVLFIGGGMGFIGWTKQKMSDPLVNTSCSLTSLAIITVLTKEGAVQAAKFSADKVMQVMFMIAMGIFATTIVSVLIWPVSARQEFRSDLEKVTSSFGELLSIITTAFLSGEENLLHQERYTTAMAQSKSLFGSMATNLKEAKYEHFIVGTEKTHSLETRVVECLQRLYHGAGGLRVAAITQFLFLSESERSNAQSFYMSDDSPVLTHRVSRESLKSPKTFDGIEDRPAGSAISSPFNNNLLLKSPSDIFTCFISSLGPSMKSLAITMKKILDCLPYDTDGEITIDPHFAHSLEDAINLYTQSRIKCLDLLYRRKELNGHGPLAKIADFEEAAASCGSFSFSLLDIAHEMKHLLAILDDLKLECDERPSGRSWNWLTFRQARNIQDLENTLVDTSFDTHVPSGLDTAQEYKSSVAADRSITGKIKLSLWRVVRFLRRDDIKYAIKVGLGATLYALPSFLSITRPLYQHWRGEWGLLSYMLVCSMTLGASNTTGISRFGGTCLGAVCAIVGWLLTQGYALPLALFGWVMALWTFYIIVALKKGPLGRFIMLTYNLTALYAYSLSVKDARGDDDEGGANPMIGEIALHRVVAVLSGCIWGLIVTRIIWPISARRKLKEGLTLLWLRMALIWQRDPLRTLTHGVSVHSYMNLREEFDLHIYLTKLENLRGSAQSEFDLRGPFPDDIFGTILQRTAEMLDAFHAINVIIDKSSKLTVGEREILRYTYEERDSLCTRISHLFQVLASSMKLGYYMEGTLPDINHTRDRLLAKIFRFRKEEMAKHTTTDEDFEILYSYILVTGQLSEEMKRIGAQIQKLFGSIDEDTLILQ